MRRGVGELCFGHGLSTLSYSRLLQPTEDKGEIPRGPGAVMVVHLSQVQRYNGTLYSIVRSHYDVCGSTVCASRPIADVHSTEELQVDDVASTTTGRCTQCIRTTSFTEQNTILYCKAKCKTSVVAVCEPLISRAVACPSWWYQSQSRRRCCMDSLCL